MKFLLLSFILAGWEAVLGTELIPERYLRPRDFNHHPFTDVGESAAHKQQLPLHDVHPYAILASKRPREGRQFPEQNGVFLPNPPQEVLPRKHAAPLQIQLEPSHQAPQHHYDADPYNIIPKNYAFSYAVKDKHSGDDFSHSQAHQGDSTRGQYRVKLPDGRTQVVSYTADDKGYRADVSYEGSPAQHAATAPAFVHSTPASPTYDHPSAQQYIHSTYEQPAQVYFQRDQGYSHESAAAYPTASPAQYHHQPQQQHFSPTPPPYHSIHQYSPTAPSYPQAAVYSPTPTPYSDGSHYEGPTADYRQLVQYDTQYATPAAQPHRFASVTPAPSLGKNFASPSPITFPTNAPETQSYQSPAYQYPTSSPGLQAYASPAPYDQTGFASPSPTPYEPSAYYGSPTPTPFEASGAQFDARYVSATPSPFAVQPSQRSTPAPFASHRFVTSTESSHLGHIFVTPRTQRSSNSEKTASRRVFGAREHVINRYKSS